MCEYRNWKKRNRVLETENWTELNRNWKIQTDPALLTAAVNQATGYASQHIWCLSQARINWEGCDRKCIWHNNGGNEGGGLLISRDGVAPSRIVGVSASNISTCTIKSRRRFLLAPAHPDSHRKKVRQQLFVFVWHAAVLLLMQQLIVHYQWHFQLFFDFCIAREQIKTQLYRKEYSRHL